MAMITRFAGFSLTSADPVALARFYAGAFGFATGNLAPRPAAPYGVDGRAAVVAMRIGAQAVELVGFDRPGAPYPQNSTSHDGWFQHLALVVPDMAAAFARLSLQPGWTAITAGGVPQTLPGSSGGVRAFKFRDPEGHPLELLQFPPADTPAAWASRVGGPVLGIDHSAIAVADIAASCAFYEGLGLSVSGQTVNTGPEQEALDAAPGVSVEVVGLQPPAATPHLELLGYRAPVVRPGRAGASDVACTRLLAVPADPARAGTMLSDPDGHRTLFVPG